jgi:hypothetical protein
MDSGFCFQKIRLIEIKFDRSTLDQAIVNSIDQSNFGSINRFYRALRKCNTCGKKTGKTNNFLFFFLFFFF